MIIMSPTHTSGLILQPGCSFGSFNIIRFLGGGGTSEVYFAKDNLERRVALKILNPEEASIDESVRKRFDKEGKITGRLDHKNIVRIYSAGEINNLQYIANEYIEGKTLDEEISRRIKDSDVFLPREAVGVLIPLVEGIKYLHSQSIVHRDLNPRNIILPESEGLKIVDFGIAKIINQKDQTILTKDYTAVGTLAYMSPEQLKLEPVTEQADLWAVGCIAYEMLTLRRPFRYSDTDNLATRIIAINEKNLGSIKDFNPCLEKNDRNLEAIIRRALDPDINERYQNAEELQHDLLAYSKGRSIGIKGDFRRRLGMTRREFTKKVVTIGIAGAALVAAGAEGSILLRQNRKRKQELLAERISDLRKEFEYRRSIYAVLDEIQKPETNNFAKLYGLLGELNARLFERLEWLYDSALTHQLISEKEKSHPAIYPVCSVTTLGHEGEWVFLTGESAVAGTLCSLAYSLFNDLHERAGSEKSSEQRQRLKEKSTKVLDDFFYYANQLYFAENPSNNTDIISADERSRAVNRFHAPAVEVLVNLKKDYPEIFSQRKPEIGIIVSNYAKAVKITIEKIIPYTLSNLDRFGSWRDNDITLMLCDATGLLNIKEQVLNQHSEYGNSIRSIEEYLDLMISEADTKISKLANSESWRSKVPSKEYTSLMLGLVHRRNLLRDIASLTELGYTKNETLLQNTGRLSKAYISHLAAKAGQYNETIQEMAGYFFPRLFQTGTSKYYLNQEPGNPVDIIPMAEALEALSSYRSRLKNINLSRDEAQFRILKTLLSKKFVSGSNKLPPSLENPHGFFRNTIISIDNPSSKGGTYIETDKILLDVIRSIGER